MKPLCIFHGNCADGFGAAWAVRHFFGDKNIEFHAGLHGNAPPDTEGRDVVIVDFCYKRPVLDEMATGANSVLVLDHHKTAQDDLSDVDGPEDWHQWNASLSSDGVGGRLGAVFDMERSGAGLTWDFFFPDTARPKLLDHIEDRDLWQFKLDGTREIQAALFSYPYDFDIWDEFMVLDDLSELRTEGKTIERKHFRDIGQLLGVCQRRLEIAGYNVPVANLPYTLTNDATHKMAEGEPFAASYYDKEEGRVFSLRSTEDGLDVSEIAKTYGGGGHKHAAGFQVPRDHDLAKA